MTYALIRQEAEGALCSGLMRHTFNENPFGVCKSVNFTEKHKEHEKFPTFSLSEVISIENVCTCS